MAKELETILIQSKTRDLVKELGKGEVRVSEEFLTALNEKTHKDIAAALKRCDGNGRKTLRAEDI